MTDPKPLTEQEIGAFLYYVEKLGDDYVCEIGWRFKATIEAKDAEIERLARELAEADAVIKQYYRSAGEEGLPHEEYLRLTDQALERYASRQQAKETTR